ncbi:MAG: M28 family peptidase [Actinobacteria bacterium]|nr:M28 family peptidase [Actinomycetota bacterium]
MAITRPTVARRGSPLLAALLLSVSCTGGPPAPEGGMPVAPRGAPSALARRLSGAVTVPGIRRHQRALQRIADGSHGNRAAGLPGYGRSVRYVATRLRSAGYEVSFNRVRIETWAEARPTTLAPAGPSETDLVNGREFSLMAYSGGGVVTGRVTPVDRAGDSSGCEPDDFGAFPDGDIALLGLANCPYLVQAVNAEAAGAGAVVVAAPEGAADSAPVFPGTLGGDAEVAIPVVTASEAAGASIGRLAEGGGRLMVSARVVRGIRPARSVVADRPGASDKVVMAGAHLDSAGGGPGINDNGSGAATILEMALSLARLDPDSRNRVRFGFWAAEEEGLLGSTAYIRDLRGAEREDIALYLNFDMLGSPNFVRFVYAIAGPDPATPYELGTAVVEARFARYFRQRHLAIEPIPLEGGSDHAAFSAAGIPVGGLFSGAEGMKSPSEAEVFGGSAGEPYDPCYHLACDTFDNNSNLGLGQLAKAAAYALGTYADQPDPPS